MNIVAKLFKTERDIPVVHSERVAVVVKRREELATKRQEFVSDQQRKLETYDAGDAKAIGEVEASITEFEAKLEATIAKEALVALRAGTATFGDAPRTSAVAIRAAWREYLRRVNVELGADEPNILLLAAAFVSPDYEDAIATEMFLNSRPVGGDLARAVLALAGESIPEATYAMQMLDISVDKAALECIDEAKRYPETRRAARDVTSAASMRTLRSRVTFGQAFQVMVMHAVNRVSGYAERAKKEALEGAEAERKGNLERLGHGIGSYVAGRPLHASQLAHLEALGESPRNAPRVPTPPSPPPTEDETTNAMLDNPHEAEAG